jgi:hypothetical protein
MHIVLTNLGNWLTYAFGWSWPSSCRTSIHTTNQNKNKSNKTTKQQRHCYLVLLEVPEQKQKVSIRLLLNNGEPCFTLIRAAKTSPHAFMSEKLAHERHLAEHLEGAAGRIHRLGSRCRPGGLAYKRNKQHNTMVGCKRASECLKQHSTGVEQYITKVLMVTENCGSRTHHSARAH